MLALILASSAIANAMELVGAHPKDVPIVVVTQPPRCGGCVIGQVVASTDGSTIWVSTSSAAYKAALDGDAAELAAVLVHEFYHIEHGPAEWPAYNAQVQALRRLR